jgi:serine protease AprX
MVRCGSFRGTGGSPDSPRRRSNSRMSVISVAVLAFSLTLAGAAWGGPPKTPTTPPPGPAYDPAPDVNSMANTAAYTGASAWWNAGYTGQGISVALIDSGVSAVEGLKTTGKVVYGPDLSLESQKTSLRNLDTFGHGTFMAGLIAGKDTSLTAPYANAPASLYRGIAPDARIVSLKVATADGGADVSQVIAAINWVIQHRNDNGLNIRVINLSYGTNSLQSYTIDPLSHAVEQAWKKGIVVVAASGNTGYQRGNNAPGLANPAYNPFVIAVGGSDSMGTANVSDDTVGSYSASSAGCGSTCKNPDFLAPGSHLQGLRVPNSYIDAGHPEGRIGSRYFRGSGTSQAAAVASGAVALILQKHPTMTPDQVKYFITHNAQKLASFDSQAQGAGAMMLGRLLTQTPSAYVQSHTASTGTGSLEAARGNDHIARNGVVLSGEKDIFGKTFNSAAMALLETAGTSWSGGTWNGSTWSGSTWSGSTWSGSTWSGNAWNGSTWSGSTWSGNTWSGSTWSGSTWSGSSWSGNTWSGNTWSGGSWLGATWD